MKMVGSGAGNRLKLIDAVKASASAEKSLICCGDSSGLLCRTRIDSLSVLVAVSVFLTNRFDCLLSNGSFLQKKL